MDRIDQYDMINAPQFLDFAALAESGGGYDDPETDKYFETHREEDDYFVPFDKLQPTIHLLNEQNSNNTIKDKDEEVDRMEDMHVEYYNTPNGKQSAGGQESIVNCKNGQTPPMGRHTISATSLTPSFHTPSGCEADKENSSPLSYSVMSTGDKTLVASSRRTTATVVPDANVSQYYLRESLLAQLEKLNVLDDEGSTAESNKNSIQENEGKYPVVTPHYQHGQFIMNQDVQSPYNNKIVVDTPPESPQEIQMYHHHGADPIADIIHSDVEDHYKEDEEIRPHSLYVAPAPVGCEVVWGHDEESHENKESAYYEGHIKGDLESKDFHRSENSLATFENDDDVSAIPVQSPVKNLRRVSSCGDITKFLVPKNRNSTTVFGFNPRAGITIPKTPDTASRRTGRSRLTRTSSNCSSKSSIASSVASSISSVSTKVRSVKPYTGITSTSGFKPKPPTVATATRVGITSSNYGVVAGSKRAPSNNTYVSFAQAVASFQKNTPTRYRSAPRGCAPPKRSVSVEPPKRRISPVSPRSPNLMTKQRSRRTITNSQNEEVKASDEHKSVNKIGAIGQKILKPPMMTLPKKIELKTTRPQPFNLTESARPKIKKDDSPEWKFRARPAPMKILQGPTGVKERQQIKTTAPLELHFASEDRIRERQQRKNAQSKEPSPCRQMTAAKPSRIPARRAPSPMRPVEHKVTTIQPFSFEQRYKDVKQKKVDKFKQEEEEAAKKLREFHANPLPTFNCKLPKRKPIEPTHVAPFRFKSEERGAAHQAALRQKMEEEERQLREQQLFYANPANVIKKKAFEPAKSSKPLVEPIDLQLNSDIRAQEREKYELLMKQKEQELEQMRLEEEAAKEERERQLELQLRQQLVHKAKPFKNIRMFEVKASEKMLVEPKSPDFSLLPSQRRPNK